MKPCSDLCHPDEPCWITECGTCDHVLEAIEHFEHRAGVVEYDGELKRPIAESLALQEVVRIYGQDAGREVQRWREGNATKLTGGI